MIQPVRIQRSRQHKQISPNELEIKYVGRPGKYGNPFKIGMRSPHNFNVILDAAHCVELYEQYMEVKRESGELHSFLQPLKGKNLSCWCKVGEACHADVLLKMANEL